MFWKVVNGNKLIMNITSQTKRRLIHGSNAILFIGIVIALVIALNFLANRYSYRFDLTQNNLFSVSDQSKQIVSSLEKDVELKAFLPEQFRSYEESKAVEFIKDLLEEYDTLSTKINVEIMNPNKEPQKAKEYGLTYAPALVIRTNELQEILYANNIDEQNISASIVKLNRNETFKIGFLSGLSGHELDTDLRALKNAIITEGNEVESVDLMKTKNLSLYSVIVIPGIKSVLSESDKFLLDKYIYEGGKVIFALDPMTNSGLEELALHYGVKFGDDFVIDEKSYKWDFSRGRFYHWPILADFTDFQIVKNFKYVLMPLARSLEIIPSENSEITSEVLMRTTERSWIETDLKSGEAVFTENQDTRGPFPLGIATMGKFKSFYEGKDLEMMTNIDEPEIKTETFTEGENLRERGEHKVARLIFFGDSDFMTDSTIIQNYNNSDLILNSINWLIEDENLISIRPKKAENRKIDPMGEFKQGLIFWGNLLGVSVLVLIYGLSRYVFVRRRRKL